MAEQLQTHIHTRDELTRVEERNRLARDLHDTVKQQTYAARMQLSAAKNLLASDPNRRRRTSRSRPATQPRNPAGTQTNH
jgi:two-component system, NarL family, sensor histidine kinase LiaS